MTVPGYPAFNEGLRQPPLGPGEVLVGKYRVEQVIGAGAMGVVVLAWHIELEQQVAIKFLYPELAANEHGAERFRREARAAVRIQNEHVARVLDVGTLEGRDIQGPNVPFIVMEYLEGRDLARELKARRTLPPLEAVAYVRQACEAVAEAHSLGIVHRDLKPANLFLSQRPNGTRLLKVLDFGISKLVTGAPQRLSITDTSILLGSPAYMSPEQLECSRSVDGRADVWSLGVILYELIAGKLPFKGDSVPQLIRSVVTGARVPLVGDDARLAQLEPIVARCLVQERADRFQSVRQLSEALDAATRGEPSQPIELARTSAAQFEPAPTLEISADVSPSPLVEPSPEPAGSGAIGTDGAWGRTHGARGAAWHRRGIPLAALLALIGLGSLWGVRSERRAADARAAERAAASAAAQPSPAPQPERGVAQLTPAPQIAPVPPSQATPEPAPDAPAPASAPTGPSTDVSAPAAPAARLVESTSTAVKATAFAATPSAPSNPPSAPTASEAHSPSADDAPPPAATPPASAPPASAPPAATPPAATPPASPPVAAPPPGTPRTVVPQDARFEIPEFGGRE